MRQSGGAYVAVDYRMAVKGGRRVAQDVLVEGVSLLSTDRAQISDAE